MGITIPRPPPMGGEVINMGHNGHVINLYGVMILMGNLHAGGPRTFEPTTPVLYG